MARTRRPIVLVDVPDEVGLAGLGAGFYAPQSVSGSVDDPTLPCVVRLRATIENGRYAVDDLQVTRRRGGPAVSTTALRDVPIAAVLRLIVMESSAAWSKPTLSPSDAALRELGVSTPTLEEVAAAYRLASLLGEPPTQTVADRFAVSRATAGRWILKAREAGHLGDALPGRAGEKETT